MNTFDIKKRSVLSYADFLKERKSTEDAKHTEKGKNDIVKKSMSGGKEGKPGIKTLSESEDNTCEKCEKFEDGKCTECGAKEVKAEKKSKVFTGDKKKVEEGEVFKGSESNKASKLVKAWIAMDPENVGNEEYNIEEYIKGNSDAKKEIEAELEKQLAGKGR